MAPAAAGFFADFLPHLPLAGSNDRAGGLVEIKTLPIPRQVDEFEHFSAARLLIVDQSLVRNIKYRSFGERCTPMCHDAKILSVVVRQIV